MSFLTPVWNYVDTLVHPVAQQDALTAARHRAFIAPRLIGSFAALASFPVYLAFRGAPSLLEVAVFGWLIVPILTAYYLSRTGRYESAHVLSSIALTGLVTVVAWCTGGIGSFAAIWLVVVPLEAALSASRRVVALASTCALIGAGLLAAVSTFDLVPAPADVGNAHGALVSLGIISAALYATGLALGAETLARTSFWLLYAEEDRYRLLARNMTDVITRHGRNGAVLFASPAAEPLFGVRAAELAGHGLFDRVHVADRPAYLTALAEAADGGERSVEFRIQRHDANDDHAGVFTWVEMRCRPLDRVQDSNGDAREVVAVLRDVSERKTQERALEIARSESERANAAKSHFLATMSHELRTPLTGIIGFTDLLASSPLSAQQRQWVEQQRRAGTALLTLVGEVLDLSRIEEGAVELEHIPFDLPATLHDCLNLMRPVAEKKKLGLHAVMHPALPLSALGDPLRLRQIINNLLSNAIRFTRVGEVRLEAAAEPLRDGRVALVVTVADTGIGIAPEKLHQVFDRFRQAEASTQREHGGSGLGLAICQRLVQAMGGTIRAESTPGLGSRFTFRIPLSVPPRPEPQPAPTRRVAELPPEPRGLRLLVAEDVLPNQALLRAVLEGGGHEVDIVSDGQQAAELAARNHYDLGILDIRMPVMDGFTAARAIRALPAPWNTLPLIALTADITEAVQNEAMAAGFGSIMPKPFEALALLDAVAEQARAPAPASYVLHPAGKDKG